MKTIREVLEKLFNQAWGIEEFGSEADEQKAIAQALTEIEGIVVPTVDELKEVLIKESNKWSGTVDGVFDLEGDQARSIHAMLKGRVK